MHRLTPGDSCMSETRRDGRCAHFGACGGCQHQDVPYQAQLSLKQRRLEAVFSAFWDAPIPVAASSAIWNYRNKVDFSFGPKQYPEKPPDDFVRETVLGYNRPGKWYWPFDVDDCRIAPEGSARLLESVRAWYRAHDLRAYDSRKNDGFLRVLLVRDAKRTGQRMVVIITSPGAFPAKPFVDAVQTAFPCESIWRGTFSRSARVAEAEEMELLYGAETIDEGLRIEAGDSVRELRFPISRFSFLQMNTREAELLYARIRRWAVDVQPSVLYDLYGGSGGIALSCADIVEVVRSIESVGSATVDGEHNAKVNGVENVFFTTERVKNYLLTVQQSGGCEPGAAAIASEPPLASPAAHIASMSRRRQKVRARRKSSAKKASCRSRSIV